MNVDKLEQTQNFKMEYTFKHGNDLVEKVVHFYLGYCTETETVISQPQEVAELGWFMFADAYAQLTHDNARQLLQKVEAFLKS